MRLTATLILATFGAAACTSPSSAPPPMSAADTPTYYRDVAPILAARCVGCHSAGEIAPFTLDEYASARDNATLISFAVENEVMPPLPPRTEDCQPIVDDRVMLPGEREMLIAWAAAGAPEGDPADAPASPLARTGPEPLGPPDIDRDIGVDYVSSFDGNDEYRCFVIDPELTSVVNVVAADAVPGNARIVHHVILSAVPASALDDVQALDAADPLPGYQCFGGSRVDGAYPIGAWVPGSTTQALPAGTAIPLAPGARIVAQVHYNFLNGRDADRTRIQLYLAKTAPTGLPRGIRLVDRAFSIPAGADDYSVEVVGEIAAGGRAWGATAHMHTLGRAARIDLLRGDGTEECLLDIPAWDFHWQGAYRFAAPLDVRAGDRFRLRCTWNNTTGGSVTFGEGTLEEMCLGGVQITD